MTISSFVGIYFEKLIKYFNLTLGTASSKYAWIGPHFVGGFSNAHYCPYDRNSVAHYLDINMTDIPSVGFFIYSLAHNIYHKQRSKVTSTLQFSTVIL